MKRKLLLLGAAFTILGSLAFGGAFSFTIPDDSDTSTAVGVFSPTNATLALDNHVLTIAADNAYHQVDDIDVQTSDANYTYHLTSLVIDETSLTLGGTCGPHDYALNSTGTNASGAISVPVGNPGPTLADKLDLAIDPNGTETDCTVEGAVVTGTFVIP